MQAKHALIKAYCADAACTCVTCHHAKQVILVILRRLHVHMVHDEIKPATQTMHFYTIVAFSHLGVCSQDPSTCGEPGKTHLIEVPA